MKNIIICLWEEDEEDEEDEEEWGWIAAPLLRSCEILCPVGTVTLDSPHPGFDPALPEECDPSVGRLVRESLEIVSLLHPNTF